MGNHINDGPSGDGSTGDTDYGTVGTRYAMYRQEDPRIAAVIHAALGNSRTVLNVGAGTGNYEPRDRQVTAVEPSAAMRAQRPATIPQAIAAVAEQLPFDDDLFDASMSTYSVHQWPDLEAGLAEMRRVTRGPVVIMTSDPNRAGEFWLSDYCPAYLRSESTRFPSIGRIAVALGTAVRVEPVAIPLDCSDGFNEAYYGRPEMLLDPLARQSCSSWSFTSDAETAEFELRLGADLASGAWDERHGHLRTQPTFQGSLVLVISEPT